VSFDELIRPSGGGVGITVVDVKHETSVSYDELADLARHGAARLHQDGIREGDAVAIVLDNSVPAVAALLAAWQAGATVVSIPPPGRGAAATIYRESFVPVLDRLGVETVVADGHRVAAALAGPRRTFLTPGELSVGGATVSTNRAEAPDIALIQFTSGSTGRPRGVAIRSNVLAGHLQAIIEALGVQSSDVATSWLPLHHDMGLVGLLLTPLAARGPLSLLTPRCFARNPVSWLHRCAQTRTTVTAAPNFAYRLATLAMRNRMFQGDLSFLGTCLAGAERLSARVLADFLEAGEAYGLPLTAVTPVYGLAEATLGACFSRPGRTLVVGPGDTVSVGEPIGGVEMRVRDQDETGRGLLDLRGEWMLDHYVTADGPVSPFLDDGWFPTSDVVSTEDGELFVYGRADEVAIVRGRNVYAEDVEAVVSSIAGEHLGFFAAFRLGTDGFAVAAEWSGLSEADPAEVARAVKEGVTESLGVRLADVHLCKRMTLPLTTSGKVKRSTCREVVESSGWPVDSVLAVA